MGLKQYIKRGVKFILHGVPERKVYAQVSYLAPSEMLKGRTALVTGGTSGIGYEVAKAYINAGARVVITGRNEEKVKKACEVIDKEVSRKGNIFGMVMNNTDVKSMPSKLQDIERVLGTGHIDILVNNAGVVGGEVKDCTEELYNTILGTNLKGTFFLSKFVARYWVDNQIEGNILMMGSSSSLRPATSAYTLTKNALYGFTKGLAKVLAPHGITVNGLAPGPTATPMTMPNGVRDEISFPNPLGRFVMPGEIANMAVFLVSNMGRSIIGDMVFMTGGSGIVTFDDVKYSF
ncbi:SDR family NAD(P)-dependent oxidoreductase [Segatella copri]|uniref:SDR family oxidoreductase n=2 Tax=Segatella copri TaxID=165179 RepID=A0AAW4N9X9_9BACT|nr:SDR family oxidoreductase [Segatella copri]MBV3389050.1 SDR family oxidoreductase [Segatella copri]MBV3396845.1 SDR family oxidoreductase [Segatella copri]MBV3406460.1 SDR family oxidoreductase [Segatella copri]